MEKMKGLIQVGPRYPSSMALPNHLRSSKGQRLWWLGRLEWVKDRGWMRSCRRRGKPEASTRQWGLSTPWHFHRVRVYRRVLFCSGSVLLSITQSQDMHVFSHSGMHKQPLYRTAPWQTYLLRIWGTTVHEHELLSNLIREAWIIFIDLKSSIW